MPTDMWLYVTVVFAASTATLLLLLIFKTERRRVSANSSPYEKEVVTLGVDSKRIVLSPTRSLTSERVKEASDKLRILNVEREILSYALRRLYEAHAEGKITAEERDRLAERYKEELKQIREEIARNESIITLNELERMQEDLIKLFTEKFDEINRKIEALRARSGFLPLNMLKPIEAEEASPPTRKPEEPKAVRTVQRKEQQRRKREQRGKERPRRERELTEADKKVEKLREEIEKVLERLSRLEVED